MQPARSQASGVPNLFRAVAECTQPYGPPASVAAVRSLQTYLSDDSCVDAVYKAILARACAEPQSEAVIAKCVALVRQYVGRHPPSAAVLAAIAAACQDLAAALPPSSGFQKSLLYLESSVTRTADTIQGNKRLAKISARSFGSNASSKGAWPHTNGDLARSSGSSRAVVAAAAAAAGSSVHSSASEDVLGAMQAKAAMPSVWGSADQQQQQQLQQQQQQGGQQQVCWTEQGVAQAQAAEAEQLGLRVVPSEAVLPGWTFQPSALQELWLADPDDESDLDWAARAPQLSPSLVPLVDGLPGMEELNTLSCQHIVDGITSADVSIQLRQLAEITEVRRLQCGVTPELLQESLQQSMANRGRRLFQPLPYTQQEQADVLASDVAAVVEILCGKPSPTTPSAITGTVGLDDPDTYWQQQLVGSGPQQQPLLLLYQQTSSLGGPQPPQAQRHAESIGQISSCILVKMVVDLWLSVGGAAAFPLVLRMLQQALYQLQPQYRARAFDIVYNLSLHSSMLMPAAASPPPSPQVGLGARARAQQHHGAAGSTGGLQQSPGSGTSREDVGAGGMQHSLPQSPSAPATQQQQSPGQPPGVAWSPQVEASPRAMSRLSRSQIGWMAPPAPGRAPSNQQQHQGQGLGLGSSSSSRGSSFTATATAAGAADAAGAGWRGSAAGMAAVQEGVGSEEGSAAGAAVPVEVAWEAWLHQLLFELLLMLSMMDEPCEAVWQSALGCLLHLTTHSGHWVAASLSQLPPAAAAALLDACVTFHWSHELHAQLVQMAANLLYLSDSAVGHGAAVHGEGSFEQQHAEEQESGAQQREQQQQQQQQLGSGGGLKPAEDSAAALTSPEDVSVTLDTLAGSRAARQHAAAAKGLEAAAAAGAEDSGAGTPADAASSAASGSECDAVSDAGGGAGSEAGSTLHHSGGSSRSSRQGGQHSSQLGDLDLPWQLHAGPVDEQQLAAFGGPAKLLQHFCHASSVEAQRTLLVPLLQVLMPPDAPATAQLAILQALCARPSCLAALQAAVSAGLPGWSGWVLQAVQQQLGTQGLDVPLLSDLLLQLEEFSLQRMAVPAAAARSRHGNNRHSSAAGQPEEQLQLELEQQQVVPQLPADVQLGVQVTLQQLRGDLPAQQQARPGLQPTDIAAYQVPAEVQGCWKALRALCWCDDDLARLASRHWLQQLLAATLQQSLEGAILLPLPGVQQSVMTPSDPTAAAKSAAVVAACESWSEVLQQLVAHCPRGPELLVDALQLHMTSCKMHLHERQQQQQQGPTSSSSHRPPPQQQQEQRLRAAVARECVQAWAFVCQWVMQARVSSSQAALTRLAATAHSMACVFGVPEWPVAAAAAAAQEPAGAQFPSPQPQQQQPGALSAAAAGAAVDASLESLGRQGGAGGLAAVTSSRDSEAGFKGVPPPEPSSEPSALARLWAGTGAAAGQAGAWHEGCAEEEEGDGAAAAAAAALAAAEGVCWPQAFLTGCSLLIQQMAQVLSGASLALLLVRLLQCRPPSRAADRGFHGRPCSSRLVAPAQLGDPAGGGERPGGVLPCPVLYPWSDGRQDLQLGLVLMLISSCSSDAESFAEFGLEAVSQQVLSGCSDPRVCLLVSQCMLEHLMQHQQDRYWTALRQLVGAAQAANDERLLGNPFLQLVALLSEPQQKQQQPAASGPASRQ